MNFIKMFLKTIIYECMEEYLNSNSEYKVKLSAINVSKNSENWIDIIRLSYIDEIVIEYNYKESIFDNIDKISYKSIIDLYDNIDKIELKSDIVIEPVMRLWYKRNADDLLDRNLFVVRFTKALNYSFVSGIEFKKELIKKVKTDLDAYPELLI